MQEARIIVVAGIIVALLVVSTVLHLQYYRNRSATGTYEGVGRQLEAAREINTAITDEQRGTLERVTDSAERIADSEARVRRSIEAIERIRGITEETNSTISELRMAHRRSSDILQAINQEIDILEDYHRHISLVLSYYFDSLED